LLLYGIIFLDAITCVDINTVIDQTSVKFNANLNCGDENYDYGRVTYQWDFGDGNTARSSDPSITHNYQAKGNFTFSVTASNSVCEGPHTGTVAIKLGMVTRVCISI